MPLTPGPVATPAIAGGIDGGPCGWRPGFACDHAAFDGLDADVQQVLVDWAAEVLWRRTGRVFGACPVTVRPCRDDCPTTGGPWTPARVDGAWTNVGWCGCAGPCGCGGPVAQVTLPGPVAAIVEAVVDGVLVPLDQLRVDNWTTVVREDGGAWPTCAHLGDPAPGGWSITYTRGVPLPPAGAYALGTLVAELAKACDGGPCRLPRRFQSITRQGVNVTMPPAELLADGATGLPEVDDWVSSVQPGVAGVYRPIRSPDLPPIRVQTWPAP